MRNSILRCHNPNAPQEEHPTKTETNKKLRFPYYRTFDSSTQFVSTFDRPQGLSRVPMAFPQRTRYSSRKRGPVQSVFARKPKFSFPLSNRVSRWTPKNRGRRPKYHSVRPTRPYVRAVPYTYAKRVPMVNTRYTKRYAGSYARPLRQSYKSW